MWFHCDQIAIWNVEPTVYPYFFIRKLTQFGLDQDIIDEHVFYWRYMHLKVWYLSNESMGFSLLLTYFSTIIQGAKQIVESEQGLLPSTAEELLKIRGIGKYTAGAIASIAFGQVFT